MAAHSKDNAPMWGTLLDVAALKPGDEEDGTADPVRLPPGEPDEPLEPSPDVCAEFPSPPAPWPEAPEGVATDPGMEVVTNEPGTEVVTRVPDTAVVKSDPGIDVVKSDPDTEVVMAESDAEVGKTLVLIEPGREVVTRDPETEVVTIAPGTRVVNEPLDCAV